MLAVLVWIATSRGAHPAEQVSGMRGTTDTSTVDAIDWPVEWHGARCISCQWLHRYLVDTTWRLSRGAAQGEDTFASFRFKSTAEKTWSRALQNVSWAEGDFLLPTYDPDALGRVMGEYLPRVRYATREDVERMGKAGAAPYQIPRSDLLPENYLVNTP